MKVWVTKINRVDQSSGPASDKMWKPHKTSVVCSQHFTPNCFTTNPEIAQMCGFTDMKRLRLEKEAYPTIFPKSQTESEREVKRQASPYAMPFHSTPKRQAFQKREHQRVSKLNFISIDIYICTCNNTYIKENSHVDNDVLLDISNLPRRTRDSFQQTYTPKLYVKSTQTKKRTTEQGSQTTGPLKACSVGTMTDPIQTRLVLPFIPPARAGESFTPETRSEFESNGSFEECIDDEWQPGIGESDEDIDLDEDEEDEDLNETA
ncbi:hypothetical protein FSP39_006696 [Pinctada imbricata]|uniref:THAP-type domain-containing protein n=1 Tax=Pinctada imbricata TaxID=66713 RepID=A0AA88YVU0_PINIB|nr:hypothetical protein FSP39_006696 [Pinctada imbricata]